MSRQSSPKNGEIILLPQDRLGRQRARVSGVVTAVVFRNEQDDWSVLTVQAGAHKLRVSGYTSATQGQEISAEGLLVKRRATSGWKNEITDEIKAERIVATFPRSAQGIASFLEANVRGVGKVLAQRLVQAFADDLLDVIERQSDRLGEVKGITPAIVEGIRRVWQEQKAVADIMLFLHDQSLSPALCRRIHRCYGDEARAVLQSNPYRLAQDVRGIGFHKADEIAAKLAVPKSSPYRIRAGLLHVLEDAAGKGHCGMHRAALLNDCARLLGVSAELVEEGLVRLLAEEQSRALEHRGCIWLRRLYDAQAQIAQRLRRMAAGAPRWAARISDIDAAIAQSEAAAGITLAEAQRRAVRMALQSRVCIITGGPGCGKTTTLNVVLDVMRRHRIRVELAAPTGKAAQRASQATGCAASTLHRLFKIGPDGPAIEIAPDVLVIDEASMVDVLLMRDVLQGLSESSALIIVGDVDQLPSVGPGAVLSDLIASQAIACTKLDVVYRQGKGSLIIEAAHAVNGARLPTMQRPDGDFFFIHEKQDPRLGQALQSEEPAALARAARDIVVELVAKRLPARYGLDPIADIMVLSPMNAGQCGVRALNPLLQQVLNPRRDDEVWRLGETQFGVGDKVIQTRNNYDLQTFNGDTGRIVAIDREAKCLVLDYDGRIVEHPFEDADELRLAYCITVHKSQGSQAPCVVIPVLTEHFALLQRNLIYTAITRAQKLCVMVGTQKAMALAVKRTESTQRLTLLKTFMQASE